jgi:hypothetical protein
MKFVSLGQQSTFAEHICPGATASQVGQSGQSGQSGHSGQVFFLHYFFFLASPPAYEVARAVVATAVPARAARNAERRD